MTPRHTGTQSNKLSQSISAGCPVRVLHSLGQLQRGGIETWLFHLAQRMNHKGIDSHLLTRTTQDEPYTDDFRKAGILLLPCLGEKNPLRYFLNFRRIVREHGPYDVLHSHGPSISSVQLSLYARLLGIPSVLLHGHNDNRKLLATKGRMHRLYVAILGFLARSLANQYVACSGLAAESGFGINWKTNPKVQVRYIGIDFEPFFRPLIPDLRASLGIPQGRFVLGHVGRYVRAKNHTFLLDIAEELLRHSSNFHFLLLGDGPLRSRIEADLKARNLAANFTLVPDTNIVPAIMTNAMDAFLLPSFHEGMPLSIVEAQAAALPCLVADNITTESILDPRMVTQLPITESPAFWAKHILGLADPLSPRLSPLEHKQIILASRFNIDVSVAAFEQIYREMAQRTR